MNEECDHELGLENLKLTFMVEAKCKVCGQIVFKMPQSQFIREYGLDG